MNLLWPPPDSQASMRHTGLVVYVWGVGIEMGEWQLFVFFRLKSKPRAATRIFINILVCGLGPCTAIHELAPLFPFYCTLCM